MVFVLIATLFSKQWNAFATFIPVKNFVCFSLRAIIKVIVKKESSMNWDEDSNEKKASLLLEYESVNGGDCSRQLVTLNNISKKTSPKDFHLQDAHS